MILISGAFFTRTGIYFARKTLVIAKARRSQSTFIEWSLRRLFA